MPYELLISEKPAAAKKIAQALADSKVREHRMNGVKYYELERDGKRIVVVCAVGHLYNLEGVTEDKSGKKTKAKYTYPVIEVRWKPAYMINKDSGFTKKYLSTIKKLSKEADSYVVATDYDIEGELIGLNVVRFACRQKDAGRMKFSTLTKHDLEESYENKKKTLNWNTARAGEVRHILDWLYGINLSRALTLSVKKAGAFRVLSSGRVQGPALKIVVEREKEIEKFKPRPYWELRLHLRRDAPSYKKAEFTAKHAHGRFWKEEVAKKVHRAVDRKHATVTRARKKEKRYSAPVPFDLTTFQLEANRCYSINPKHALDIAQRLYLGGYISYPRTSSQKLPPTIGYEKILHALGSMPQYERLVKNLLSGLKKLSPKEGKKSDPAHPAIYPTGQVPKKMGERERKLYDLIVRRFLATFAESSVREHMSVDIDCNGEPFKASGIHTLEQGWQEHYAPYVHFKEERLPELEEGQKLIAVRSEMLGKETQPPSRYSQASLVRELAKRDLGTKGTRAAIVDHLFQRGYLFDKSIRATSLGMAVVETLQEHCPRILDEKLTRQFEKDMKKIEEGKAHEKEVLDRARKVLLKILHEFKEHESEIGEKLKKASRESWLETHEIGPCSCGGTLVIRRGKFGQFVGCTNYPECNITFKLPNLKVVHTGKVCETCGYPVVKIIKKRPQNICINPECPEKQVPEKVEVRIEHEHRKCPRCKKPLVLRKSIYGEFLGCSGYPKCRYTENLDDGKTGGKYKRGKTANGKPSQKGPKNT